RPRGPEGLARYGAAHAGPARADGGVPHRRRELLRQRDGGRAGRLGFGLELPADPARGAAQPVDAVGGAAAARHRRPGVRRHQAGGAAGAEGPRAHYRAQPHGVVPPPEVASLVVDSRLPRVGQPSSGSYEGDGYITIRHPETEVVTAALKTLVSTVRVELG